MRKRLRPTLECLEDRRLLTVDSLNGSFFQLPPLGSQVHFARVDETITAAEIDTYTVDLDPGQILTVTVTPSSGDLAPSIDLLDPNNVSLGSSTGSPAVLQTIPISTPGTYTINLEGLAGTTGDYELRVGLNTAGENEFLLGALAISNDTLATAEDLEPAFLHYGGGVSRTAVIGAFGNPQYEDTVDMYKFELAAGDAVSVVATEIFSSEMTVELLDPTGTVLALAEVDPDNPTYNAAINGAVAEIGGTYYARVTGSTGNPYVLAVFRNEIFDQEYNNDLSGALDIGLTGVAQGFLGPDALFTGGEADDDFYSFAADSGAVLDIQIQTPGDGPYEGVNTLDSEIELFDPSGVSVASNTDPGNGSITYTTLESGVYTVRLGATSGFGEYLLRVNGHNGAVPEFHVRATSLDFSGVLLSPPSQIAVEFNDALLLSTLQASDLTLEGVAATGFTRLGPNVVMFDLPSVATTSHTLDIAIAAGAISDIQGTPITAFNLDVIVDDSPVAHAGGPYVIDEGDSLTLDASLSYDPNTEDTLTYTWDIDEDGVYGDATGVNPTLTLAQLVALGIDDGPMEMLVRVRVSDGFVVSNSPVTTLTINSVAPVGNSSGPTFGVRGQPRTYTLAATDPSPSDQETGFNFDIDWDGDGNVDTTLFGLSGRQVEHVFPESGSYTVRITARDKDGVAAGEQTFPITISDFALQPDEQQPGLTNLVWGGTDGLDASYFIPGSQPGDVLVFSSFLDSQFVNQIDFFSGVTGKVLAYGQGIGDVFVAEFLPRDVELYGGDGNDVLVGGPGSDILRGGEGHDILLGDTLQRDGNDSLVGDGGRDLLFGHLGADTLDGGADDDLLLSGGVQFNDLPQAVFALQAEWISANDYETRVANLRGTGYGPRANGETFLVPQVSAFHDDAVDNLVGNTEQDWFLLSFFIDESDAEFGEIQTDIGIATDVGQISGRVFEDINGNGIDDGEPGLSDVILYVDLNNNLQRDVDDPLTTSSSDGSYAFTGLPPGRYSVRQELPPDSVQSAPTLPYDLFDTEQLDFSLNAIKVSPDGLSAYAAPAEIGAGLVSYSRDPLTGDLTFIEVGAVPNAAPYDVVISPDGNHVYMADHRASVVSYERNAATSQISVIQVVNPAASINTLQKLAISPDGLHVYASGVFGVSETSGIGHFSRDPITGILTDVGGVFDGVGGIETLQGVRGISISPDGKHLYAAAYHEDAVTVFSRDLVTGELTLVQVITDGQAGANELNGVDGLATSPDGQHVYVTTSLVSALTIFSRDATTGQLTFVDTFTDDETEFSLTWIYTVNVSQDSRRVVLGTSKHIIVYARDPFSGEMLLEEAIATGQDSRIRGLDFSPDGQNLYAGGSLLLKEYDVVDDLSFVYLTTAEPNAAIEFGVVFTT